MCGTPRTGLKGALEIASDDAGHILKRIEHEQLMLACRHPSKGKRQHLA